MFIIHHLLIISGKDKIFHALKTSFIEIKYKFNKYDCA